MSAPEPTERDREMAREFESCLLLAGYPLDRGADLLIFDLLAAARAAEREECARIVREVAAGWVCTCDTAFKDRGHIDPSCAICNAGEEMSVQILARLEQR